MTTLKCLGSGSQQGNCYLLSTDTETLILDCGIPIKEIKRGLGYDIKRVSAVLTTHRHQDHFKSAKDFKEMGIKVIKPWENPKQKQIIKGGWIVKWFDLTTLDGKWTHTNTDGTECPCYGFYITHPDMGRLIYITDTEFVKWRFTGINHILISCNYMKKYLSDDEAKRNHVLRGHMELDTVKDFVKVNKSNALRNAILCHLSGESANGEEMVEEVEKVAGIGVKVDYAEAGKAWELSELPF